MRKTSSDTATPAVDEFGLRARTVSLGNGRRSNVSLGAERQPGPQAEFARLV
jgi:hypothetical protein